VLFEGASDHRMADYQPLLTRAVANLPSTNTVAARLAIYERARKAQLAQLRTLRPPLSESDIALEEEALEKAITLVEAKFGVTDFASAGTPFAATTPAAAAQQASGVRASGCRTNRGLDFPAVQPHQDRSTRRARREQHVWAFLAAVLGAVLAIACAAIMMRQKPRYLALSLPEVQEALDRRDDFRWPPPPGFVSPPEDKSTAPTASVPPGKQLTAQSGSEPANQAPDASSPALTEMARAAMVIASDSPRNPVVSLGSTVWSTIPVPGQPARVAVKADADLPELKMHATMTLRKNADPTLLATHD
jgi:hypothetical protein